MMNGQLVEFVEELRYLGHVLSREMRDDSEIRNNVHAH